VAEAAVETVIDTAAGANHLNDTRTRTERKNNTSTAKQDSTETKTRAKKTHRADANVEAQPVAAAETEIYLSSSRPGSQHARRQGNTATGLRDSDTPEARARGTTTSTAITAETAEKTTESPIKLNLGMTN